MQPMTVGEFIGLIITVLGGVAWLTRLEMRVNRGAERDEELDVKIDKVAHENDQAVLAQDNRLNKVQDATNATLVQIYSELKAVSQSVNDKFTVTSNSVAKLEGIMLGREVHEKKP